MAQNQIGIRLFNFTQQIAEIINILPDNSIGNRLKNNLMHYSHSANRNYEQACLAQTRAEFGNKLGITLKNLEGYRFWLKIAGKSKIVKAESIERLQKSCEETCKIVAKSIQLQIE